MEIELDLFKIKRSFKGSNLSLIFNNICSDITIRFICNFARSTSSDKEFTNYPLMEFTN